MNDKYYTNTKQNNLFLVICITLLSKLSEPPINFGYFNTELIKICGSDLFCKGGAEGVFLFAHLKKKIVGVIKVNDGNERALPSSVSEILKKLNIQNYHKKIKQ